MVIHKRSERRRGAITVLTAILSAVLVGMVAFAVDTSWIVLTRSELQNAADSAALAGAGQLMNGYVMYNLPTQSANQKASILSGAIASVKASAKQYAAYNSAGGVSGLVLNDSDIEAGFMDGTGKYTVSTASGPYPNTVKVLMRRDSHANQSLKLFFAPVLGVKTMDIFATASATCYTASYSSFNPGTGLNVGMLPVTYDINYWNNFLKTGKDPDGNVNTDSNGNPVLQIYPSSTATGNFGELSLNDSHNGASTTAAWIDNGMAPADVQTLLDHNLIPLPQHPANTWDWQGNPGFKASNVMEVNNFVGKTFLIPLFQPVNADPSNYAAGTGQGANYNYDIVAFVSVTIMPTTSTNRTIIVQPGSYIDPSAVFAPGSIVPMGTASALTTTFTAPKLSS